MNKSSAKSFLDTSVLVAAFQAAHPAHRASIAVYRDRRAETDACAAHSLAEFYSVLTRMPLRPRVTAPQATLFIADIRTRLGIVALDGAEYWSAIEQAATAGVTGGRIYDALLVACARKHGADRIFTLNTQHFAALAPDLAGSIVMP